MSIKDAYIAGIKRAFDTTEYGRWLQQEGVLVHEGFTVEDVRDLELAPWPRLGGNAVFITLYAQMEAGLGLYLAEIPPGGTLEPERYCCQKVLVVLQGEGTTEVWQEGDARKRVFEWGKGSVFTIPINAWHRMYNLGREPVKFLVMNNAPQVMNGFHSPDFLFHCPYVFRELFSGDDDQFFVQSNNRYDYGRQNLWETNFIRDAWGTDLKDAYKAYGNRSYVFRMANKTMGGHINQWPVGRYHKAHYHGPGALLVPLRSEGFVLLWPKELGVRPFENGHEDEVVMAPWKAGGLYTPPDGWFHQHFNTGSEPARQLAFHGFMNGFGYVAPTREGEWTPTLISIYEGGSLVEYPDEDPEIRKRYKAILDAKGVPFDMPDALFEHKEAAASAAPA